MEAFRSWMQQPTTVAGMSTLFGTALALLMHQVTWMQAVPLFAGAAASAILPDNSGAKQEAQLLAGTMMAKFTSDQTAGTGLTKQTESVAQTSH